MRFIKKFWFTKMKNNLIFILFVLVWIFTIQSVLLYYYHYFNSVNKLKNNLPKKSPSSSNVEVKLQKLKSHETTTRATQKLALPPQQQQSTNESTINIMLQILFVIHQPFSRFRKSLFENINLPISSVQQQPVHQL